MMLRPAWCMAVAFVLSTTSPQPVLAQGSQSTSGPRASSQGAAVAVGAGTVTEVTTGASGPDMPGGDEAESITSDMAAGRNGECRALPDLAARIACLQGHERLGRLGDGPPAPIGEAVR